MIKNLTFSIIIVCTSIINGLSQIPDHIQQRADSLITDRIGAINTRKFSIDCAKSGPFLANSVWEICKDSTFKTKRRQQKYIDKLWIVNDIEFYWFEYDYRINDSLVYRSDFWLDTLGNYIKTHDLKIPDVRNNPDYLSNTISKERAIFIADSIGFDKGVRDWQINFAYNEKTGQFCWEIRSFGKYIVYSQSCIYSSGEMIKINCTTEDIEAGSGWAQGCVK